MQQMFNTGAVHSFLVSDSPAYYSEPDSQSRGEDVTSVDTSGTDYSSSSDGQFDTSSEESSDDK
jgi:hypothetical protein